MIRDLPVKPDTQDEYRRRILQVLVYIQNHLDDALCLEEVAAVAHFSPFHFHRVFRGMVGEPLMEHLRRLRLERAALRLKSSGVPITRIAFEAGYETHEAFTRAFGVMFGESPSSYRQSHRPVAYAAVPSGVHFTPDGPIDAFTPYTQGEPMDVRVETVEPMRVAFVRHIGPYAGCCVAWEKLCGWAGPRGLLGPKTVCLGVSYDDPDVTPADKIRYDACIVVGPEVQPSGDIGVQEVGGGQYAVTVHRGPYEHMSATYARLCGEWLPAHGREPRSAPSLEIFLNYPEGTPPEELRTEIYVPLADVRP